MTSAKNRQKHFISSSPASAKKKRLDAVEVELTPKEWAIRLADQMRGYPSQEDFALAISKGTYEASPLVRPFYALQAQAEDRHPKDIQARNKLDRALRMEYHGLKGLIISVNEAVKAKGEVAGLKAALKVARLEAIVLQDAFGRTARKGAEWVQEYKTADAAEEESRQGMLAELAAYTDVDYGEKWADSVPLPGGLHFRFPSVIEDWVTEVVALAGGVFAHRAAVQVVQQRHFDGHPILFLDVEAALDETIKTLEDGIATFNAYLKTRAALFIGEWEADEEENDGIASAIPGEREGRLVIDIDAVRGRGGKLQAKVIAAEWLKNAKFKAKLHLLEESNKADADAFLWSRLREEVGGHS
jgi:hypothetical protein